MRMTHYLQFDCNVENRGGELAREPERLDGLLPDALPLPDAALRQQADGRAHPSRTAIMDLLPRKREHKRVPALSPAVFAGIMDRQIPEHARPCYYALAITGFRLNECLALERISTSARLSSRLRCRAPRRRNRRR
jgi:hypothetical protein